MWTDINKEDWFVLFVKTNFEEKLKKDLSRLFGDKYEFLVPKRVVKERRGKKWFFVTKPLFTGYIIFKGQFIKEDYYKMKDIPDIYYLIKSDDGPLKMMEEEISVLKRLLENCKDDTIGTSEVYFEGDQIFVKSGPLHDLEGMIVKVNKRKGRAKVKLTVGGSEKLVDLSINLVSKK